MANLLSSFVSSATALDAYDRVLQSVQSNVANASTPGYARQRILLHALPFDPSAGITGGVRAGELESARNRFAEQAVRRQIVALGRDQQNVDGLTALESLFDISGASGIPKAMNDLFQSFSAWGASPTSGFARQQVIDSAGRTAQAFRQMAASFDNVTEDTTNQLRQTVGRVNELVGELRDYNAEVLRTGAFSSGIDARIHEALEELAEYVDLTAVQQTDQSFTILLNGQKPLLVGDRQYALGFELQSADADAPPTAHILASDGSDLTAQVTNGRLGALVDLRNRVLAGYIGSDSQPGSLNQLARALAERVNQLLTSGLASDGPPPVPGAALFTFDAANDSAAARTLQVDSNVTPAMLGAIDPGPPSAGNGIPLALAALAAPSQAADKIDQLSFTEFFGRMAAQTGSELEQARSGQQAQESLVAQAKSLREQLSGVSLNEEATLLLQFQRSYEAMSRFIRVLDSLSEEVVNILR